MKVGFLGLGHMGSGMAARLVEAGHDVTVWNRTRAKTEPLRAKGASVADTPADACAAAEAVFTMLADDHAVEEVTFGDNGILGALPQGAVHISSSTLSVDFTRRLAAAHKEAGQRFLAAPVFGRPDAAAAGQLFVVAGGEQATVNRVQPLLDVIGKRTFVISDRPEAAALVKLSGNFLIASMIESVGEAMALVDRGGVDRHAYLDMLTSTLFDVPLYKNYGKLIAERKYEPAGFAAPLGQKDIRLALAAGEELRVPMPVASLLRDRFLRILAKGGSKLDWAAIGDLATVDSGK
ncbi:MAG TPA: NAD(P)-dependent oxidoreductase [Gemmatimonadaceae bacterium]|nr:NAD(P)-dependent oxidoreductase [Gemmatimonadaceae bacterium]